MLKLILCFDLQRELARQTMLTIKTYSDAAVRGGFPEIRTLCCIGGDSLKNQIETIKRYPSKFIDLSNMDFFEKSIFEDGMFPHT